MDGARGISEMSEKHHQKTRTLKVQNIGDHYRKEVIPQVRIQGKWLLAAGLKPETHVSITNPQPGVLIVKCLD
jgi:hypothetical protein